MEHLSGWLSACVAHAQEHAKAHLAPAIASAFVTIIGVVGIYAAIGGGIVISEVAGLDESIALLLTLGGMMLGVGLVTLLSSVLIFSYSRYIAGLERGEPPASLFPGIGELFTMFMMTVIVVPVFFVGFMLCVLPGIIVGLATSFAFTRHALQGGGAIENLRDSVDVFRNNPLEVGLYIFIIQSVAGAVGGIPCVGLLLVLPIITIGYTIGWLKIMESRGETDALL